MSLYTRGAAAFLFVVIGCSPDKPAADTTAAAQPHDMSAMAGHDMKGMDTKITIPQGALYTVADVQFMQGMIAHHAQAIFMSRLAAKNGANPRLVKLANKIDQSQMTEIRQMQGWLVANGQTAPDTASYHHVMMQGMLTPEQMKALDTARGAKFDELFLTGMIQHHKGALKMVADLREAGGGKEPNIGGFLNDVDNDQRAEIVRMYGLLGRPVEWK